MSSEGKMEKKSIELGDFAEIGYWDMWGIKYQEKYALYFDESNNCRKFWINDVDGKFNVDINEDFVLAGVGFKDNAPDVTLATLVDVLGLQKNVCEVKFNRHFSEKTFLECMDKRRMRSFLEWLRKQHAYIHYLNVNNLYYAIVELLDSITEPKEITEFGFEYFRMKSVLYETLKRKATDLQKIMFKYKFPNISEKDVSLFCKQVETLFPARFDQTLEQKFLFGCLRRAESKESLIFLKDNTDFVMQENYTEFYLDAINTYKNSSLYFDEEDVIQKKLDEYSILRRGKPVDNYTFVKSSENIWIQISDVIAGIFGKLFKFVNDKEESDLLLGVKEYSSIQVDCICLLNELREISNMENKGFLHSIAPISTIERMDKYLAYVEEWKSRR